MKRWRVNFVFIIVILFGAAIISRLVYIQIIQHDLYRALANGQQKNYQLIKGERGEIFFSGGEILATNVKGKYLFVSPEKIKEKEKTAQILSEIFGLDKELIFAKLKKNSLFEQIKSNLTEEENRALGEINLPGVYLGETFFREYPQGLMASQTVGFIGGEEKGQYGIEGFYDDILQGKEKIQNLIYGLTSDTNGADIFLTINYELQFKAEKLLEKTKEEFNVEEGQIVIVDPKSGAILALANFPNFDPNYYSKVDDFHIFQNNVLQKLFEPGSVFKSITMAAALDQDKITPKTTYIDEGNLKIGGYTIYNYNKRIWGERTMTEVLEKSINTGAIFAERQIGHKIFLEYLEKFGFFEPTEIDLQGEIFSENKEFKKSYEINFATASFGQGIEMTPIQLVQAFNVIANNGKLVRPYIVEKVIENGSPSQVLTDKTWKGKQVISSKTSSQLTAMMISVVENGSAKNTKIPGYYIAGKTGTSQIPWTVLGVNKKGYSDKTWQSFIGFFPAFNPKFLILVKLDNPETKTSEYSAVPIFKEMAKYIIDYYEIPPDYEPI